MDRTPITPSSFGFDMTTVSLGFLRVLVIAGILMLSATSYADHPHFVSPNRQFEAYTTSNAVDGTGVKLFLRRAKTHDTGILVFHNMRWIDAKWSPDSRFLAVVDHNDGHIADVYVFGVRGAGAAQPQITLYHHTPKLRTYDVRWDVIGWRVARREVILSQEVRDQNARTTKKHQIVAHIGNQPLKSPNPQ